MVSQTFKAAIRLSPKRGYQIAHEAGIHPSTLSRIICGIEKAKDDDPRVLKVAQVLGLEPTACFETEGSGRTEENK
jgi:hypothetical protein